MALYILPYSCGSVTEVQIGVQLRLLMLQKLVSWAGLMTVVLLYIEVGGFYPSDFGLHLKCSHFEAEQFRGG